jgi:hypothetical protein
VKIFKQKAHYIFISGLLQALILLVDKGDIMQPEMLKILTKPRVLVTLVTLLIVLLVTTIQLSKTLYIKYEDGIEGKKVALVFGNERLK